MTAYLMFNCNSKEFIGITPDRSIITQDMLYKTVSIGDSESMLGLFWDGDYDSGKLVRLGESNTIREEDLEFELHSKFFSKRSIESVVCNILSYLNGATDMPIELERDVSLYDKYLTKHKAQIKYYKDSEDYIFKEK
jgi:hypothetical protein